MTRDDVGIALPPIRVPGRHGLFRRPRAVVRNGTVEIFLTLDKPAVGMLSEQVPALVLAADGDYEKLRLALLDIVEALP